MLADKLLQEAACRLQGFYMTPQEKDFLLAEFKSAWDTVNNIDNRRAVFASYFSIIFAAVFSVFAALAREGPDQQNKVVLTLLLVTALVAAVMIFGILWSERKANRTYRNKINLIRELLIGATDDAQIKEKYLRRGDLNILLSNHIINTIGRTLSFILCVFALQCAALCGALVWLWGWAK